MYFRQDFEILEMSNLDIEKLRRGEYRYSRVRNQLKGALGEYYSRQHLRERYPVEFGEIIFKPERSDLLPPDQQYLGLQGLQPDALVPCSTEKGRWEGWYEAVVDSKAWRNFNANSLAQVAERYANLPLLHPKGRVILVVPDDTYRQAQDAIARFTELSPGGKQVEVWKMGKTNAELEAEAKALYDRWKRTR